MTCDPECCDWMFDECVDGMTWYTCRICWDTKYEYLDCVAGG